MTYILKDSIIETSLSSFVQTPTFIGFHVFHSYAAPIAWSQDQLISLFDNVVYNSGSFSAGLFTAPEDGIYEFLFNGHFLNGNIGDITILKNNLTTISVNYVVRDGSNADWISGGSTSSIVSLVAGDTIGVYTKYEGFPTADAGRWSFNGKKIF